MSCPAESHTLEEFEKKKGYETDSNTRSYRPNGVKIIKAVKLYSQKEEDKKAGMKLEELLEEDVDNKLFVDSAWGCECQSYCKNECNCQSLDHDCGADRW